ncbi:flavoprotein, HI0933 family [Halobacteroides halobius DSM 5150]|uniref:Flavoprotein, HI0933 family n=1 Tax=Halobacteroides halobius (strain ATCC 35273 / DSM 5150 / MD-1) TaxID=748449 RepID=L0KBA3_HALHC|nr:NAD(P)/FAD-dependent oxidoreductase [Halobacteroides halobius]AGB41358.1 flavoprotein, HI0933 family [Halobacteroides halobius DSM 5150]
MYDLIVVGGGAAGMMAAGQAATRGKKVLLLEKNEQVGKKLLITGKGRCNLTNDCDIEEIINNFPDNGKFLYSSLYTFSNWQLRDFFAKLGVKTKVERGNRVFPTSDSAHDIVSALKKFMEENGVEIRLNSAVETITVKNKQVTGVQTKDKKIYFAANILLAVGGKAYPTTGSSGDGYDIAKELGHRVIPSKPSLVPLEVKEDWAPKLQGLNLRNVTATLVIDGAEKKEEFGEMLFTHFGVSGPIILTLSRDVVNYLGRHSIKLRINLKPALSLEQLDNRLQRDFAKYSRKQFKNSLGDLLPSKLIPVIVQLSSIPATKFVNQITRKEREELVDLLTNLKLTITGTQGFKRAIVTVGGIDTEEINPSTLESKLVQGLYFAGEVIDVDAYTGGFNLQGAFSMGYVVGNNV